VALLNEESIRTLASFKPSDRPVVTAYLDVDGKRWPKFADVEARLDRLVREASEAATSNGHGAAVTDLERIQGHVKGGLDRSRTRGLAIFSCGDDLWEVHRLPVRVKDQLVVNQTPHVRQLERIVDNYKGFGFLLADKQRTRMFVFELNELVDKSEVFEALPRHPDDAGDRDRGHERGILEDAAAHQHVKRAAQLAFEVWKQHPFDHLILSAGPEIAHELEADLHSYLKERIRARINIPASSPEAAIVEAVLDVEEEVERSREAAMVDRLRDLAGGGRGGVVGLDGTLTALSERRVDTLVVSDGFVAEGWRCHGCGILACVGRTCPTCGAAMVHVDDIVEEAVEVALLQSCHVEMCVGNADLDVAGRVGALLRF
jgi:peptide chain release factor subunit 1